MPAILLAKVSIVEHIIQFIQPLFKDWGYLIVFLIALLEHSFLVGLVVPGDAVLLLGALYAGLGDLNIFLVISLAFVGSVAGDNLGYFLGLKLGRPLIEKHGDFLRLKYRVLLVEKYFQKYGGATVFIARFATFIGTLVSPVAGMSRMNYRHFIAYEMAGSFIWAVGYGMVGFFFGRNAEAVEKILNYVGNTLLVILIVFAITAYVLHRVRKKKKYSIKLDQIESEAGESGAVIADRGIAPGGEGGEGSRD